MAKRGNCWSTCSLKITARRTGEGSIDCCSRPTGIGGIESGVWITCSSEATWRLKKPHCSSNEFCYATPFVQISGGRVAPGPCDPRGGAPRLERRSLALELHPLCLLEKRPAHRCARCVACASVNQKPADRGRTSPHRQSDLDQAGYHGGGCETHRDIRTPAGSAIRTQSPSNRHGAAALHA